MGSLRTLVGLLILGAIGYGAYISLTKTPKPRGQAAAASTVRNPVGGTLPPSAAAAATPAPTTAPAAGPAVTLGPQAAPPGVAGPATPAPAVPAFPAPPAVGAPAAQTFPQIPPATTGLTPSVTPGGPLPGVASPTVSGPQPPASSSPLAATNPIKPPAVGPAAAPGQPAAAPGQPVAAPGQAAAASGPLPTMPSLGLGLPTGPGVGNTVGGPESGLPGVSLPQSEPPSRQMTPTPLPSTTLLGIGPAGTPTQPSQPGQPATAATTPGPAAPQAGATTPGPSAVAGVPSAGVAGPTNPGPTATSPAANANAALSKEFSEFIAAAEATARAGRLDEAHVTLSTLYNHPKLSPEESRKLIGLLNQIAGTAIYSREHLLERPYRVQPGDTWERIGQTYSVPGELLAKINYAKPPALPPVGAELKVVRGPFDAVVDLSRYEMALFLRGRFAGRFRIGLGADLAPSEGTFAVRQKQVNPQEIQPVLGSRSLQLDNQFMIHGSPDAQAVGRTDGRGNIRLTESDLGDVFDILSVGSTVTVRR